MPSLDVDTLEASWADTTSRSSRLQKASRIADRPQDARRRSSRQAVSSGSPEKRPRTKIINKTSSSPSASSSTSTSFQTNVNRYQDSLDVIIAHVSIMLSWLLEVLSGALRVLKTPISYLLAVWFLFGLGVMMRNLITNSLYASLSPVCRVPGASLLSLPFCPVHNVDTSNGPPPSVEFDQLMTVQSKFEEVLEEGAGSVSLPMDMKRGEASIRDLRQLVKYSQIHSK
jgi:hypothetical protein